MYYLILLVAGILQGLMVSLNARLGLYYTLFGVTLFVHGIALVLLLIYLLMIKRQKLVFRGAPWYVYLVGAMGIGIVASSAWGTMHIGAGALMALSTAGQLVSSELTDLFGLFGTKRAAITKAQLPGFFLVTVGVVLVIAS